MYWYTAQKDFVAAVLSLIRIGQFNGVSFEELFVEAKNFLHGKRSKATQCDFQPPLRLGSSISECVRFAQLSRIFFPEDLKLLGKKYPDFDPAEVQLLSNKQNSFSRRFLQAIAGHHYQSTLSTFYPTDFFHSPTLAVYLAVTCGLWFVSPSRCLSSFSSSVVRLVQVGQFVDRIQSRFAAPDAKLNGTFSPRLFLHPIDANRFVCRRSAVDLFVSRTKAK